ncbi:ATP12 family protein [Sphingosinicella sp. LHD-64]|uniref:ATP12 family chaperone protein n=1 Tax=Sphingosinicella sp. LHD-64 TaxID=3072139 RepID=UPI00280E3862|nr:ATP12 family protein [Sphingosinicella sp. LHD-64]MDQ8755998.1 ATP12 family protein [Sphingosinicella sp. LHD-64]
MKRFYKAASVAEGNRILLDGRPVKTPGRADLAPPHAALANAIAAEWNAQGETVDPRSMPMTGLANAAIDRIAPDTDAFARSLAVYGESDLLCYRADRPAPLAALQAEHWDPLLVWARRRYDIDFAIADGVIHTPQPQHTVDQLAQAVLARDAFQLAGLSPLVTVGGSLVIALALAEGAINLDAAWAAATVDEAWQAGKWGEDAEAVQALASRRADFAAGHRFLTLLPA